MMLVIEHWQPELRDPEYGTKRQLLARQEALHPGRPLALVLGSSRVLDGLRPELLPAYRTPLGNPVVFNFGLTGAGPIEQLLVLRRLLEEGHHPRWVMIEVLPSALPSNSSDALTHTERQSWDDLCVLRPYAANPIRQASDWLDSRVIPWFSCRFCLLSLHFPRWVSDANRIDVWNRLDSYGWMPLRPSGALAVRPSALAIARYQHAHSLQHFTVTPVMDRALRDLLDLCQRERIAAALLVMPESKEFRSWYAPMTNQLLAGYLDHLGSTYHVPVYDARTWVVEDHFCDGHHLLPEGAEDFTRRFGSEVLTPFLAERAFRSGRPGDRERRDFVRGSNPELEPEIGR